MKKIRLGEPPFFSFQGEGRYTGIASVWIRLFGCNRRCQGFSQKYPERPETYVIRNVDISSYNKIEDLPVITAGCDSAYSVSHLYKHLTTDYTPETLADKLLSLIPNNSFRPNLNTGNCVDLCITGGEPMLQQSAIIDLVDELIDNGQLPNRIQIETNGTVPLKIEFENFVKRIQQENGIELCFNISPKLKFVSGEIDAVKPEIILDYCSISTTCDLKFVMSNRQEAWEELKEHTLELAEILERNIGLEKTRFYVMPVGASKEQQESDEVKQIVYRALNEGYHISGRLHCAILGNLIGT